MATEADVCASCSSSFDDLKCAIKCNSCEKYFHGPCEGVPNLKGFHMKRATWKCQKCTSSDSGVSDGGNPRKRQRSQNDDVIVMDRMELLALMETIKKLTATMAGMEEKMVFLQKQNDNLTGMVSTLLDKQKPARNSYAEITSKNLQRATPTKTIVNTTPAVLAYNTTTERESISKSGVSYSESTREGPYQPAKMMKKRRSMKPLIIGSNCTNASDSTDSTNLMGAERRHWVYVGRVSTQTTIETVIEHVKATWSIDDVACVQLSKRDDLSSFKVGVKESVIPSLLDASKWPKFVAVREFIQFSRKRPSTAPNSSGNFTTTGERKAPS